MFLVALPFALPSIPTPKTLTPQPIHGLWVIGLLFLCLPKRPTQVHPGILDFLQKWSYWILMEGLWGKGVQRWKLESNVSLASLLTLGKYGNLFVTYSPHLRDKMFIMLFINNNVPLVWMRESFQIPVTLRSSNSQENNFHFLGVYSMWSTTPVV